MMRIAKYPHLPSVGFDFHQAMTPPLPVPLPPVPSAPFIVAIATLPSSLIFGKFTVTTLTEYQLDTLMGHDWGMLQVHLCLLGPYAASPSNITTTLGSSHKYFLPCYSVQEMTGGGAMQLGGASGTPVAITTPAFIIPLQDCMDVGGAGFVAPTGIGMQVPGMRWVGFSLADLLAGLISMATDAVSAFVSSKLGSAVGARTGLSGAVTPIASGATATARQVLFSVLSPADVFGVVFGAVLNVGGGLLGTALTGVLNDPNSSDANSAGAIVDMILVPTIGIGFVGGKLADFVGTPTDPTAAAAPSAATSDSAPDLFVPGGPGVSEL